MTKYRFQPSQLPHIVFEIARALEPDAVFLVGGAVRDAVHRALAAHTHELAWTPGANLDLATRCRPDECLRRLAAAGFSVVPVGIEHGTVGVPGPGGLVEITTFRSDYEYDGRHCRVAFSDTLEEDLLRRDFTVNALAADVTTGQVVDTTGGIDDLGAKVIRTVGEARARFLEDHLRILRGVRFAAKLDFALEEATRAAMQELAPMLSRISGERIRDELLKILGYPKPSAAFRLMRETGILKVILPELEACFGVEQNQWHSHDVGEHSLLSMDALSPRFPFLRFVTLLHDIGKPGAKRWIDEKGDYVFYGHEETGARMTEAILDRLRFSRREVERGAALVAEHMISLPGNIAPRTLRRYLARMGGELFWELLRLRVADRKGNLKKEGADSGLREVIRKLRAIEREQDALSVKDLALSGQDLIELGLTPGPLFGEILSWLLAVVLDDPSLNRRETLLSLLRQSPYGHLLT
ncbi:CCA tRNA nucleotidyltransferase [bacterium]|nr:CCA tRNA nucleotidyltransferase [bacterium]